MVDITMCGCAQPHLRPSRVPGISTRRVECEPFTLVDTPPTCNDLHALKAPGESPVVSESFEMPRPKRTKIKPTYVKTHILSSPTILAGPDNVPTSTIATNSHETPNESTKSLQVCDGTRHGQEITGLENSRRLQRSKSPSQTVRVEMGPKTALDITSQMSPWKMARIKASAVESQVPSNRVERTLEDDDINVSKSNEVPLSMERPVPNTPAVIEISKFERRPRQPSILRMVQQGSTGDTFNSEDEDGIEDQTTLAILERLPSPLPAARSSSQLPDRSSRSRKRKRTSVPHTRSSEGLMLPQSEMGFEHIPSDPAELTTIHSMPLSAAEINAHQSPHKTIEYADDHSSPARQRTTSPLSPPAEDEDEDSLTPIVHSHDTRSQIRLPIDLNDFTATSPLSTPTSSATPTVPVRNGVVGRTRLSKPMTSAQLRDLLPQRRRNRQGRAARTFDIHSSSSDQSFPYREEHEEQRVNAQPRRARNLKPSERTPVKVTPKRQRNIPNNKSAGEANVGITTLGRPPSGKKTYTRRRGRVVVDKENSPPQEDESDDQRKSQTPPRGHQVQVNVSRELVEAKEKFKEVDQWELSFESCDIGAAGGNSSPWR